MTLYVILGSHACRSAILMLDHKAIPYRLVNLVTGLHPFGVRLRGFPGAANRQIDQPPPRRLALANRLGTVPALRVGDARIQTNREIARYLDRVQPDPPLFPPEAHVRREVEAAEQWGDEVFQMAARRIVLAAAVNGRDALRMRGNDGRLGPLLWRNEAIRFAGATRVAAVFAASTENERQLLDALPVMLDRIDAWIEAGVLGGESLNAADFLIAPSLALLGYRPDLNATIEARPAGRLLDRVLPEPGLRGTRR